MCTEPAPASGRGRGQGSMRGRGHGITAFVMGVCQALCPLPLLPAGWTPEGTVGLRPRPPLELWTFDGGLAQGTELLVRGGLRCCPLLARDTPTQEDPREEARTGTRRSAPGGAVEDGEAAPAPAVRRRPPTVCAVAPVPVFVP